MADLFFTMFPVRKPGPVKGQDGLDDRWAAVVRINVSSGGGQGGCD